MYWNAAQAFLLYIGLRHRFNYLCSLPFLCLTMGLTQSQYPEYYWDQRLNVWVWPCEQEIWYWCPDEEDRLCWVSRRGETWLGVDPDRAYDRDWQRWRRRRAAWRLTTARSLRQRLPPEVANMVMAFN